MQDDFGLIPYNKGLLVIDAENIQDIVFSRDIYIDKLGIWSH